MRFSLKDVLLAVAFCAAVLACSSAFGFTDAIFWGNSVAAGALSAVFVALLRKRSGLGFAAFVTILALVLGMALRSATVAVNSLLLFLVLIYAAGFVPPLRLRTLSMISAIVLLIAIVTGTFFSTSEVRKMVALRRAYPIVSLTSRLQYEMRRPTSVGEPLLQSTVGKRLDNFEANCTDRMYRSFQLEWLHNEVYEKFARTNGFGESRVGPVAAEFLSLPALRNLGSRETFPENFGTNWELVSAFQRIGTSDKLEHLHSASMVDFLDPSWFGAVLERLDKVAGFVSHGFHFPPAASLTDPNKYQVEKLELVSLLKFDRPQVYELGHLPRMDQLSGASAPTRDLDDFENGALAKLRTDEDVVIQEGHDDIRMLGSLRAAKQCMNCHSVERGELLGAFSYVIRPNSVGEAP
jgi:hypothetical protein